MLELNAVCFMSLYDNGVNDVNNQVDRARGGDPSTDDLQLWEV